MRKGKKHSHNKLSYNYHGSPTQADHNSKRSQYSHIFFTCLVALAVENLRKSLLPVKYRNQVFSHFHF